MSAFAVIDARRDLGGGAVEAERGVDETHGGKLLDRCWATG
jgi:hypothetical protein